MAPPHRPAPRRFSVLRKQQITPGMLRLTLGGAAMEGFPPEQEGGYLKLRLPCAQEPGRVEVRTYTIRAQREGELDVDFALHGGSEETGPATRWALSAQAGDEIEAGGPGAAKPLPAGADFYLIAGDMTALPAISVNLAALPAHARGLAVLEIASEADRQDLARPVGVALQWLITPPGTRQPDALAGAIASHPWPGAGVQAWVACEFSAMKALRAYLREDRGLTPAQLYISSYWKAGLTEDGHREVKQADAREG